MTGNTLLRWAAVAALTFFVWTPGTAAGLLQGDDKAPSEQLREASRRLNRQLRKLLESPEYAPWDLGALAQKLGHDPEAIRKYVTTGIRFEAYPGLQRGPVGVLASGAGNSGDKALLLAELLRRSGHPSRIVRGRLDAGKAGELLATFTAAPAAPPEAAAQTLQELCTTIGLDATLAAESLRARAESRQRRWDEVVRLATREARFVEEQQRAATFAAPVRRIEADLLEWTRTHYWVEWKPPGGEEWVAVDACFAAVPQGLTPQPVDPEKAADRLSLSLTMDRMADGKRETVRLFSYELPVQETLLKPLRFFIQPIGRFVPPEGAEARVQKLKSLRQFQGLLMIGSEKVGSKVFDLDGGVHDIAANGSLVGTKEKVGGAIELLEGLGGEPKKKKTELISLSVVFEARREDQSLWRQDRVILEEGARESWCPILEWNLFLQSQEFSSRFVTGFHALHAIRNERLFERMEDWTAGGSLRKDLESLVETPAYFYPLALLDFCRSRQKFVRGLGGKLGMLWEAPDLFISGQQVRIKDGGKSLCTCQGMDLVENGALVLDAADHWTVRREQTTALGVFDTALEQVQVGWANESEGSAGTISAFERERCLGRAAFAFTPAADGSALQKAGLPKTDAEWIRRNTRAGRQILAAGGEQSHCAGAAAWWELDPSTGRIIGRISGGRGGCLTFKEVDYVMLTLVLTQVVCYWRLFEHLAEGDSRPLAGLEIAVCVAGAAVGAAGSAPLGAALVAASFLVDRLNYFFGD